MEVKNVNGTAGRRCKCGSWIEHWQNYSQRHANTCSAVGCNESTPLGAHVKKCNSLDNKEYIVPFCQKHNKTEGCIELVKDTVLAPANVNRTCNS